MSSSLSHGRSDCHNYLKSGKLHFRAPIGSLVHQIVKFYFGRPVFYSCWPPFKNQFCFCFVSCFVTRHGQRVLSLVFTYMRSQGRTEKLKGRGETKAGGGGEN